MPRRARAIAGGLVYHVLNRSNVRITLFCMAPDYDAFLRVLEAAQQRVIIGGPRDDDPRDP